MAKKSKEQKSGLKLEPKIISATKALILKGRKEKELTSLVEQLESIVTTDEFSSEQEKKEFSEKANNLMVEVLKTLQAIAFFETKLAEAVNKTKLMINGTELTGEQAATRLKMLPIERQLADILLGVKKNAENSLNDEEKLYDPMDIESVANVLKDNATQYEQDYEVAVAEALAKVDIIVGYDEVKEDKQDSKQESTKEAE